MAVVSRVGEHRLDDGGTERRAELLQVAAHGAAVERLLLGLEALLGSRLLLPASLLNGRLKTAVFPAERSTLLAWTARRFRTNERTNEVDLRGPRSDPTH